MELLNAGSDSASELGSEISFTFLAMDTLKQEQSLESDIAKIHQFIATETPPTQEKLQGATLYILTMAQHFSELAIVESLLALKAQDGSYRVVVHQSLVVELIDEAH